VPTVAVAFVQRFLELAPAERDDLLRSGDAMSAAALGGVPALPSCTGKPEPYVAGGLAALWPVGELLLVVKVLHSTLTSLQVVEMLAALLVGGGPAVVAANRAAWEDALRFTKADLANAVRNPVDLRDVPDAQLPRCQALGSHVLATVFQALRAADEAAAAGDEHNHDDDDAGDFDDEDDEYGSGARHQHQHGYGDDDGNAGSGAGAMHFDSPETAEARKRVVPFGAVDWIASL
jgi:hypothetical protein